MAKGTETVVVVAAALAMAPDDSSSNGGGRQWLRELLRDFLIDTHITVKEGLLLSLLFIGSISLTVVPASTIIAGFTLLQLSLVIAMLETIKKEYLLLPHQWASAAKYPLQNNIPHRESRVGNLVLLKLQGSMSVPEWGGYGCHELQKVFTLIYLHPMDEMQLMSMQLPTFQLQLLGMITPKHGFRSSLDSPPLLLYSQGRESFRKH
jgi:hypothetical protein